MPDSQVYSCNVAWFRKLPAKVREGIEFASDITFQQNLAQVPASRAYAMAEMTAAGVKFYVPTAAEIKQWADACGWQRPEWNAIKTKLAGSLAVIAIAEGGGTAFRGPGAEEGEVHQKPNFSTRLFSRSLRPGRL